MGRKAKETDSRLRLERMQKGISIAEMANLLACSEGYLSNVEAGRRPVADWIREGYETVLGLAPGSLKEDVADGTKLVDKAMGVGDTPALTGLDEPFASESHAAPASVLEGEMNVLRKRIEMVRAAVLSHTQPRHREILVASLYKQVTFDQVLAQQWKSALIQALEQGYSITHIWQIGDDDQETVNLVGEMLDFLGHAGSYHPYYIRVDGANNTPVADLLVVPGQGAMIGFDTTQPGYADAAFFFADGTAETAIVRRHFAMICTSAQPLFTVYQEQSGVMSSYLEDQIRAYSQPGELLIELDRLSIAALPHTVYREWARRRISDPNTSNETIQKTYRLQTMHLKLVQTLEQALAESKPIRQIASRQAVAHLIQHNQIYSSVYWMDEAESLILPQDEIHAFVRNVVRLLQRYEGYEIALVEKPADAVSRIVFMMIANDFVILRVWVGKVNPRAINISIQEPAVISSLREYFDKKWDGLPDDAREKPTVMSWLSNQISTCE